MKIPSRTRRPIVIGLLVVLAVVAIAMARGSKRDKNATAVPVQTVERQSVAVTIEATGTVEPIDLVEVKSKASGQIVRMPVQVGSQVRRGDLLAQIDTRDVQNQYNQAAAAYQAARSKAAVANAQKKRADDLYRQQVITATEHETATLDAASARAQLVAAAADLDIARQRREDARVQAPIAGTVLEQSVAEGQVISSATSSASGGTTLLKMADLSRIRMRALVSESDIGTLRPGQPATVTVDAFPNRTFMGQVEKIEPQAVVQQSVTMFPVLVSLANDDRVLLPGMNGEVTMLVDRRDDVVAVSLDAVRTMRDIPTVAPVLGLDPDSTMARVQRQARERWTRMAAAGGDTGTSRRFGRFGGDSAARAAWRARRAAGGEGGAWAGRSGGGAGGGRRGGFGAGGGDGSGGEFAGGASGKGGSHGEFVGGASGRGGSRSAGGGFGAGAAAFGGAGGSGMGGGRASRVQVVFVKTAKGFEPRIVRLGLSNYDVAQVLDGVQEGEQVALLSVAELQAKREQDQTRFRQRMGGGVPGAPGLGGGGRGMGGGGGGGGGGTRSGGGH